MATGVYGTMFESTQTELQRERIRERHDGKGASNNSARLFPESPINTGLADADNRGGLDLFNDTAGLRQSFAKIVDSDSVEGGFGFEGEPVNLNYGAEGRPEIFEGIATGEGPVGAPSLLPPDINKPTESDFVASEVRPELRKRGFGTKVNQPHIRHDGEPVDTISKYFSSINGVE